MEELKGIETRLVTVEQELLLITTLQQQNTTNIALLIAETRALVNLQKNIEGTLSVGKAVQNFMSYIIKWPVIGAGIYSIVKFLKELAG